MDKNSTNSSGQNMSQSDNSSINPSANIGSSVGGNKYPSFDTGGDNYAKITVPGNKNLSPSFEVQENLNKSPSVATNETTIPQVPVTTTVQPATDSSQEIHAVIPQGTNRSSDYTYASVKRRYFASAIDSMIVSALTVPLYVIPLIISGNVFSLPSELNPSLVTNTSGVSSIANNTLATGTTSAFDPVTLVSTSIATVISFVYPIIFIGKKGATPGKKLLGIKVIDKDTKEVPGFLKAFLREFVGKIISISFLLLGYLWAVWDKDKQAWHDKIAGTVVVKIK